MADEQQLLRHASRMAMVTFICRVTGYLRDKAIAWVLGAGMLNDAYRMALRIPNAFRALLAEGALHAAFIPALSQLRGGDRESQDARELVRGLLAVLLLALSVVVGLGILLSPWVVRLYASGFADSPGKLEITIYMNRLMFPYLALISLAALCQGVLNSRDRFLLSASTPVFFNLAIVGFAWGLVGRISKPEIVLSVAVLVGGLLQMVVQIPAVIRLGFSLRPLWQGVRSQRVRQVMLLMLPGIPVLGINQLNQLISGRFASYLGDGAVACAFHAHRVTELMFGGIVIQLTTVLLPTLSRELREAPEQAPTTLSNTISLVSYVTLPTAVVLTILSRPIIGLLFGGGLFDAADVTLTGAILTAYAFSLVGTGHAKVIASSFFAHKNTLVPMWGSAAALAIFTAACWYLIGPFGVPGLGWANTIAMLFYAVFLSILFVHQYGLAGMRVRPLLLSLARQVTASALIGAGLWQVRPWLATVEQTSLAAALRMALVLAPTAVIYIGLVCVLGGRELQSLLATFKRRRKQ